MGLADTRKSLTHKAVIRANTVDGRLERVKFFFTVGIGDDGRPMELFMHMDESGSTLDGFADSFSILFSLCLQAGVPLTKLVDKLAFQDFEPKGLTDNPQIRIARSVVDYVVRWIEMEFKKGEI